MKKFVIFKVDNRYYLYYVNRDMFIFNGDFKNVFNAYNFLVKHFCKVLNCTQANFSLHIRKF